MRITGNVLRVICSKINEYEKYVIIFQTESGTISVDFKRKFKEKIKEVKENDILDLKLIFEVKEQNLRFHNNIICLNFEIIDKKITKK